MSKREQVDDVTPGGAYSGRLGRIADRVLEAVASIEGGLAASAVLARTFKRGRDLGAKERHEIADIVYALIKGERRLEDTLARAAKAERRDLALLEGPIRLRLRMLAHLAENGATLDELVAHDAYAAKRVHGLFARILAGKVPPAKKRGAIARIGIEHGLPDWMVRSLVAVRGEVEAERVARALAERAPLCLRVNTLVGDRDAIRARILAEEGVECTPTARSPWGLTVPGPVDLESWAAYRDGAVEVQDEGSQLIALALGARPGETILDACAGAGGKALAIAAMMGGTGRILAVDPEESKLGELKRRARRAGLTNLETETRDFVEPAPPRGADRVLVDAPCTGSGRLRREPDGRIRIHEEDLARLVPLQVALLRRAVDHVRPGGLVLYATCSILEAENEAIVREVLEDDARSLSPRLAPAPLAETLGGELAAHQLNFGPGSADPAHSPDGFFLALLRRTK